MKVLALDDERNALEMLIQTIQEVDPEMEVHGFHYPEDAMDWAEKNAPIDVAFLDIQTRGITGLTVAKHLKKHSPKVNLIFTTGYSEYAVDACNMQSSGYLLKPVNAAKVSHALENLLFPIAESHDTTFIRTFGSFEVFVNNEIVHFGRSKAKEMLAYLVDRRGSAVSRKEIFAVLFGDDAYNHNKQAYLTNIIRELQNSLKDAGLSDILVRKYNTYAVNPQKFTCDLYEYDKGDPTSLNQFHGEYMVQYSWSEDTLATLYR